MRRIVVVLAMCCSVAMAWGDATADLGSEKQATRDAAAAKLRATYVAPSRAKWDALAAKIKPGDSKQSVLDRLKPFDAKPGPGASGGGGETQQYRLDGRWILEVSWVSATGKVTSREVRESLQYIWVEPPPKFTGTWTTYFVNGQKAHEVEYKDGQYFGVFTSFHPDGSKAVVQHYNASGADGEDIGYFPSGKVYYRGRYKAGKQVGTWTWYNEDGSVKETRQQP